MIDEIEKKFNCEQKEVMAFFQNLKEQKKEIELKFINQVYMHTGNSIVVWNEITNSWDVRLFKYGIEFSVKAKSDEIDKINELIKKCYDNLSAHKDLSIRLRKTKQKDKEWVEFTIKFPTENEFVQHEFEYVLNGYEFLDEFFELEKSCVKKTRYVFSWNKKDVELDIFINSPHIVLEVEFDSIEEMESFSYDGLPIIEETNISNKYIAFSHLNNA